MLKAPRLLLLTAMTGLVVLSSGCYTQLAASGIERRYPNTGIIVEEKTDTAAVDRFAPGDRVYASDDAAAKTAGEEPVADERTYVENRYTGGLSDEYVLRAIDPEDTIDNGHLGYTHQEVLATDDGGMVVNNYYFDTNPWYDTYSYRYSYLYDPWDPWWGRSYVHYRPWRPYYDSGFYLSVGYSWYDPWDPWYYDPWYDPWDFIAWDYYYYPHYSYWHPYRPYHYYAWSPYDHGYLHGYHDGYYYGGGSSWVDSGSGDRREDRMAGMNDGVRRSGRATGSVVETAAARRTTDPVATNSVQRATRRSQPAGVTDAARSASSYTTGTTRSTYTRRVTSRSDYIGSYAEGTASRTTGATGGTATDSRTRSTGTTTAAGSQQGGSSSLQRSTVTTRRIAPESGESTSTSRGTYSRTTPGTRSSSSSSSSSTRSSSSSSTQSSTSSGSSRQSTTRSSSPRTAPSSSSSSGSSTRSSGSSSSGSSSGSSSTRSSGSSGSSSRSSGSSSTRSSGSSGSSSRSSGSSGSSSGSSGRRR